MQRLRGDGVGDRVDRVGEVGEGGLRLSPLGRGERCRQRGWRRLLLGQDELVERDAVGDVGGDGSLGGRRAAACGHDHRAVRRGLPERCDEVAEAGLLQGSLEPVPEQHRQRLPLAHSVEEPGGEPGTPGGQIDGERRAGGRGWRSRCQRVVGEVPAAQDGRRGGLLQAGCLLVSRVRRVGEGQWLARYGGRGRS